MTPNQLNTLKAFTAGLALLLAVALILTGIFWDTSLPEIETVGVDLGSGEAFTATTRVR